MPFTILVLGFHLDPTGSTIGAVFLDPTSKLGEHCSLLISNIISMYYYLIFSTVQQRMQKSKCGSSKRGVLCVLTAVATHLYVNITKTAAGP